MTNLLLLAPLLAWNADPATLTAPEPQVATTQTALLVAAAPATVTASFFASAAALGRYAPFTNRVALSGQPQPAALQDGTTPAATTEAAPATTAPATPAAEPAPEAATVATPAPQAPASAFSYSYLQLGGLKTDYDNAANDTTGWDLRGSIGVGSMQFFGNYTTDSTDLQSGSIIDTETLGLGLGGHWTVAPKLDLLAEIEWIYSYVKNNSGAGLSGSDHGWGGLLGARWMALPFKRGGLELNGGFTYVDALGDGEAGGIVGGRLHFLDAFSLGLEYTFLENSSSAGLNLRYSF